MSEDARTEPHRDHAESTAVEEQSVRLEVELAAAERLTFFSDAEVAIAITLLALDLVLPTGTTDAAVLDSMGDHWDSYLAFLISFAVIGQHWRAHHQVFRYLRRLDTTVQGLSFLWLLMIVLTPFTTRVITGEGAFFVRFALYAAVQALASLSFLLMLRGMKRHRLLLAATPPSLLANAHRRAATIAASFAASIPVALVGAWAFLLWGAMPLSITLLRLVADRAPQRWPRTSRRVAR